MVSYTRFLAYALTITFILPAAGVLAEVIANDNYEAHVLYTRFKEYRKSLADKDANASVFFTKNVNEEWLGWVVKERSSDDQLAVLSTVRNRMRFGDRIDVVHEYSVVTTSDESAVLVLVCSSDTQKRPRTVELTYVKDSGIWYIDKILSDETRPGENESEAVVDYFK